VDVQRDLDWGSMCTRLICAFAPTAAGRRRAAAVRLSGRGSVSGVSWTSFRSMTTPGWSDGVTP
jgi:hypothetical protein